MSKIDGSKPKHLEKNISRYSIQGMNTSSNKGNNAYKSTTFNGFMSRHVAKEGEEVTHTRIPDKQKGIHGGKYHIPDEELDTFYELYKRDLYDKKTRDYYTEKQRHTGPLAIDLDFHYNYEVEERQHTQEHVESMVLDIFDRLKSIYNFDSTPIKAFIMEKADVNRVHSKKITKDGIHMIINIEIDTPCLQHIRSCMMESYPDILSDLPIVNETSWEGVIDNSIMTRKTGWQLYGCRKPDHKAYAVTSIYEMTYDEDDGEFQCDSLNVNEYMKNFNMYELSVRNTQLPSFPMKSAFISTYEQLTQTNNRTVTTNALTNNAVQYSNVSGSYFSFNVNELLTIKTVQQMNTMFEQYMAYIHSIGKNYELVDIVHFTMALPSTYYDIGSYEKWFRVCCALKNSCPDDNVYLFLPLWLKFSSQSSRFDYGTISDLISKWEQKISATTKPITKRSIAYWAKNDCPEKYQEIIKKSTNRQINVILRDVSTDNGAGYSEVEICKLVRMLVGDRFVCASHSGSNCWYKIVNGRYIEDDGGNDLRLYIQNDIRKLFQQRLVEAQAKLSSAEGENTNLANSATHAEDPDAKRDSNAACTVYSKCGREAEVKKIVNMCKSELHEYELIDKIDANPELLCFENGVFDFNENIFRKARPDDYLSKCTNINYITLTKKHQPIIKEIEEFMRQLFPEPELNEYMWNFLGSTLNGTSNGKNQKFQMFTGGGANGKSVLLALMEKVLGDYKVDAPTTVLTEKRQGSGSHNGYMADVKGARLVCINEPSKGDKINEGVMKQLTSNTDKIQAREIHKKHTTFTPQCNWVLATNTLMDVGSNDYGTWRRINVVPFKALFTENPVKDDPNQPYQFPINHELIKKFDDWKEVFASMLLNRAVANNGIVKECAIVREASDKYKQQQDYFSQFVTERIQKDPKGSIKKADLVHVYSLWHNENMSGKPPQQRELFEEMDKLYKRQTSSARLWKGVSFIEINDDENPDDCVN